MRAQTPLCGDRRVVHRAAERQAITLALCLAATVVAADELRAALGLLEGDPEQGVERLRALADEGDVRAQFAVGVAYLEGIGVEPDATVSARWFEQAAREAYAPAQFNLGNGYRLGTGLPRDEQLATHWWTQAAEQGLAEAQFNLALAYHLGRGVTRDPAKAAEWYRSAAANGSRAAQRILAHHPVWATKDLRREDWVRTQERDHYTIQLFAGSNAEALLEYARAFQLNGPLAYFGTRREGRPWYSLIFGSFSDANEAREQLASLPAALRENSPWIRSFEGIHQSLGAVLPAQSDERGQP